MCECHQEFRKYLLFINRMVRKESFICFLIRKIHLSDKGNVTAAVSVLLALISEMYLAD